MKKRNMNKTGKKFQALMLSGILAAGIFGAVPAMAEEKERASDSRDFYNRRYQWKRIYGGAFCGSGTDSCKRIRYLVRSLYQ